jgi:CheY-like chemotaxis protein
LVDDACDIHRSVSTLSVNSGLPAIFQRYHHELLPESVLTDADLETARDRRNNRVTGISSLRHNSMGMGLSLAYHVVRTLGGELRYAAKPEKYTKFWFSLPHNNGGVLPSERIVFDRPKVRHAGHFAKQQSTTTALPSAATLQEETVPFVKQQSAPSSTALASSSSGAVTTSSTVHSAMMESPSVLVVEDVPICAKLLCTILRQFNCLATWVKNGQEAVDILTKEPERYDLVFMDLRMPIMDGLTATKIIKGKLKMQTPVVALTGEGGDQIRAECMQIGFNAYCKKPMTREELMKVVQEHTGYVHR